MMKLMKTWRYPHSGFWALHALTIPLLYLAGRSMQEHDQKEDR